MEILVKVIMTEIILCLVINNITPYKFKISEYFLMLVISEILAVVINTIKPELVSLVIFTMPIYLFYSKSKKIVISTVLTFTCVIISIISDYIVSALLISALDLDITIISKNEQALIGGLLIVVSYIISKILGKFIGVNLQILKNKNNIRIIWLIFFTVVITFSIFYINISWTQYKSISNEMIIINGILFFSYFIIMIITVIVAFNFLNKELEVNSKQEQLNNLQDYAKNLEYLYTDMRKFRHDYINIISSIIGYIDDRDLEGLEEHVYKNIIPLSKMFEKNNNKIVRLKYLHIPEIKGIVATKLLRAQDLGIDVYIDIVEPVLNINIDIIDLSRIIGIILDNAIEGALEANKPSIKVAFINRENSIIVLIINSCKCDIPPIYKLYEQGYSTKGNNRGLGLSSLREILSKYNNVTLDTIIEKKEFIQNIQILNR